MYLESAYNLANDTVALFEGPWVTTSSPTCSLVFYYHLTG